MKNEKFLLDTHAKCGSITNEIWNEAIDAEWTFKYKWSKVGTSATTLSAEAFPDKI